MREEQWWYSKATHTYLACLNTNLPQKMVFCSAATDPSDPKAPTKQSELGVGLGGTQIADWRNKSGFPMTFPLGIDAEPPLRPGRREDQSFLMPEGDDKDQMQVAESAGEWSGK